ncbi:acyltransferase [Marinithermofilum abyssi]|uniref:acyltransferase n=1 Tax=Marinithermofilum abyssi TaxID=1571185 RepID=UPI001669A8A7|nr:acyltransferase [Marinithermofilum abyssi]
MRRTERYPVKGSNSLWQVYSTVPFWRTIKNAVVIQLARYNPSFRLKNWMYRRLLGITIGEKSAIAMMVMMDVLHPQRIYIGDNSILGYNTTVLTHEYLVEEYRLGDVRIGNNVMVGANSTILPGVTIGDHAVVGAGSLVNADVPPYAFVAGCPARIIRYLNEEKEATPPEQEG